MLLLSWLLPRDWHSPEGFVFVRDTYIIPQISSRIKGFRQLFRTRPLCYTCRRTRIAGQQRIKKEANE
jgi:hypothetical protein